MVHHWENEKMNTINYIEAAKKKLGVTSNYALAKELGMSQAALSRYKSGDRVIDDYTAAKLAELLELEPIEVIAAANAEREKDSAKAAFWRKLAGGRQAAGLAGVLILAGFLSGTGPSGEGENFTFYTLCALATVWALYVILGQCVDDLTYKARRK